MTMLSITAIERGVVALAKRLIERYGLVAEITAYRSGRGGDPLVGGSSHVDLEVTGQYRDQDGDVVEAWSERVFTAGNGGCRARSTQVGARWRRRPSGTSSATWRPRAGVGPPTDDASPYGALRDDYWTPW